MAVRLNREYSKNILTDRHNVLKNRDLPDQHPIKAITGLEKTLNDKVDKVVGKGLSTEDFTTEYKNFIDNFTVKNNTLYYKNNKICGFEIKIVSALPTTNIDSFTIYLIPSNNKDLNNVYSEYIYINSKWEMLGSVDTNKIDLTDYINTEKINKILENYNTKKDIKNILRSYIKETNFHLNLINDDKLFNYLNDDESTEYIYDEYKLCMTSNTMPEDFEIFSSSENNTEIYKMFDDNSDTFVNIYEDAICVDFKVPMYFDNFKFTCSKFYLSSSESMIVRVYGVNEINDMNTFLNNILHNSFTPDLVEISNVIYKNWGNNYYIFSNTTNKKFRYYIFTMDDINYMGNFNVESIKFYRKHKSGGLGFATKENVKNLIKDLNDNIDLTKYIKKDEQYTEQEVSDVIDSLWT